MQAKSPGDSYLANLQLVEHVLQHFVILNHIVLCLCIKVYLQHKPKKLSVLNNLWYQIKWKIVKGLRIETLCMGTTPGCTTSISWQWTAPEAAWQKIEWVIFYSLCEYQKSRKCNGSVHSSQNRSNITSAHFFNNPILLAIPFIVIPATRYTFQITLPKGWNKGTQKTRDKL